MDNFKLSLRSSRSDGDFSSKHARDAKHKPVVRHARGSTRILKEWFSSHTNWPYPTQQDKDMLSDRTGLTVRQISHWFVNARRRSTEKLSRSMPTDDSLAMASLSAPAQPGHEKRENMTPIDRWRNSPPEEEPAPLHAISKAIERSGQNPAQPNDHLFGFSPAVAGTHPSSLSSSHLSSSGPSGESSAQSCSSTPSFGVHDSGSRPRQRKSWHAFSKRRNTKASGSIKNSDARIYQCTFCTDSFKSRYDWTRHEGTLHLVLERWTCLLSGPRYRDPTEDSTTCVLCGAEDPSDSHIESHRAAECMVKPLSARAFHRKDHIRQHLRLVHGVGKMLPLMDAWKAKVTRIKSRCGFCGENFLLWPDRNDHLTDHFRAGAQMKDWKGCRGLDPAVALLVENAIPPYLIGVEAADPEPFSASRGTSKGKSPAVGNRPPPTAFESLTEQLGKYVQEARSNGLSVTDDLLRREARLILYTDDDPWNYTPADNPQWLNMFKIGYGLALDACQGAVPGPKPVSDQDGDPDVELNTLLPQSGAIMAPFTMEKMQLAAGCGLSMMPFQTTDEQHRDNPDLSIPWAWQTPECLAEFSQMGHLPTLFGSFDNNCVAHTSSEGLANSALGRQPSPATFTEDVPQTLEPPTHLDDYNVDCLSTGDVFADMVFPFDFGLDSYNTVDSRQTRSS